MQTGMG